MEISKKDLKKLSKEILLEINEDNLNDIHKYFKMIVDKLESIKGINTKNIKPMNMIFEEKLNLLLRDDNKIVNLTKKEVLSNAPQKTADYFIVHKVR